LRFVVDASTAVEYLLRTPLGTQAAGMLDEALLFAPELLDAEVLSVLRRCVGSKLLATSRALEALDDLAEWDIERLPHRSLLTRAWALRHNVTAYDALYVASAEARDAIVLTAGGPLARAPTLPVAIQNIRST
jgi:predicted nucleic acid-binding protein